MSVPDCTTCGDEGVIYVMGQSVNPYSGVLTWDPQEEHEEPCPDCNPPKGALS
jgi:hypothetical protein